MSLAGRSYYALCRTRTGHAAARGAVAAARRLGWRRRFTMPLEVLELDHASVAALMTLWSRIHWSSGDGMMPPEQLLAIFRLARQWPAEGDLVELGAWVGLTTCYLATAARVRGGERVYAVDTFRGTREGGECYPSVARFGGSTLEAFRDRVRQAGVSDLVEPIVADTGEAAGRYAGRPIRFLLIDADHSYEGVRRDFESWLPHVAPGGMMVFHDYAMPEAGVARFVDEDLGGVAAVNKHPGAVAENIFAVTRRG